MLNRKYHSSSFFFTLSCHLALPSQMTHWKELGSCPDKVLAFTILFIFECGGLNISLI